MSVNMIFRTFVAAVVLGMFIIFKVNQLDKHITFQNFRDSSVLIRTFQRQRLNNLKDNLKDVVTEISEPTNSSAVTLGNDAASVEVNFSDLLWFQYGKETSDIALIVNTWLCVENRTKREGQEIHSDLVIYSSENIRLNKVFQFTFHRK